jgi:Tfp pilus assembly protein PilV
MIEMKKGFTFVEVMVCIVMVITLWLAPLDIFARTRSWVSYGRHRIQAVYLAKQIIEELHKLPYANIVNRAATAVAGNETNPALTVANATYSVAVTNVNSHRNRVQVEIDWTEPSLGGNKTMREYVTTDITDNDVLN